MSTGKQQTAYEIPQIISEQQNNQPQKVQDSPDFFISGENIYAPMHKGNKVHFFTTGADYFLAVAQAIEQAKHSIFIAGWQINLDVQLPVTKKIETYTKAKNAAQAKLDDYIANKDQHIQRIDALASKTDDYEEGHAELGVNSTISAFQSMVVAYERKIQQAMQGKTLWAYLRAAVERGVNVYVMPWSCPPVGPLVTYDLEAMCCVFQLNVGLKNGPKAFFTFSSTKSDMGSQKQGNTALKKLEELGGMFFSHHQKTVIIDNEIAYLGGIDLAYGRRDDNNFRLACDERLGNDKYNPCIPHIKSTYRSEYVTRNTLLFTTLFEMAAPAKAYQSFWGVIDVVKSVLNWNESPYSWQIAYSFRNYKNFFLESTKDIQDYFLDNYFDPALGYIARQGIDLTLSMLILIEIEMQNYLSNNQALMGAESTQILKELIQKVKNTGSLAESDYPKAASAIRDWMIKTREGQLFSTLMDQDINISSLSQKPQQTQDMELLIARLLAVFHTNTASFMEEPYSYLHKNPKPLRPRSGTELDPIAQPRMPWHDMQIGIQGPAVYDVSRNFIDRWNAGQMFLELASNAPEENYHKNIDSFITALLKFIEMLFANIDKAIDKSVEKQREGNRLNFKPLIKGFFLKCISSYVKGLATGKVKSYQKVLKASKPQPFYINQTQQMPPFPRDIKEQGDAFVQIIRSASTELLKYEHDGRNATGIYLDAYLNQSTPANSEEAQQPNTNTSSPTLNDLNEIYAIKQIGRTDTKQDNCQQAWIKAIEGAQHYIYIESQYFQSDFGEPLDYPGHGAAGYTNIHNKSNVSGPMASLVYFEDETLPYMDYIGATHAINEGDLRALDFKKIMEVTNGLIGKGVDPIAGKVQNKPRILYKIKQQLSNVWTQQFTGKLTKQIFTSHEDVKRPQKNKVAKALIRRIQKAIACEQIFHTYLVMPVHPEGLLNDTSIIHGVHMAMQTLYSGQNSLVKQIQIAMCIKELRTDDPSLSHEQALEIAYDPSGEKGDPLYSYQDWNKYLTVLNLRTWETLSSWRGDRNVTEQIYVHSKLLIVDDNIAIVGSCNVNDRAMMGDRDSEIAAIIRGNTPITLKLNGETEFVANELVHNFRVKIWRKLFAIGAKNPFIRQATSLSSNDVLHQPAAPETVRKIQGIAKLNLDNYVAAFPFIPQDASPVQATSSKGKPQPDRGKHPKTINNVTFYPLGCSIWPLWVYKDPDDHAKGGEIEENMQMPFDEQFWNNQLVQYGKPRAIEGFITAMPLLWTRGENNLSPTAQTIIAAIDKQLQDHYHGIYPPTKIVTV